MGMAAEWRLYRLFAGCLLVSFISQAICTSSPIGLYDEGVILFGARRILDGDLIHRDFYTNYGPGQFYALAGLFKVFGSSVLVERLWDVFLRSVSVSMIFLIVARSTRSVLLALGTAAVGLVWFATFGFYGYPVFPALAAALTGVVFLQVAFEPPGPAWSLLAAGICAGIAFLFRYDVGISTAAVMAFVTGLQAAAQPSAPGRVVRFVARSVALFSAGFAVVALPVIGAFIGHQVMGDLVFDVVTFPSEYYVRTRSLPFPGLRELIENPPAGVVYMPPVLVLAVSAMIGLAYRDRKSRDPGPPAIPALWVQIVLIGLSCVYFAKGIVRVSAIHMSMAIITSVVIIGIGIGNLAGQSRGRRAILMVALVSVTIFTGGAAKEFVENISHDVSAILAGATRPMQDAPPPWLPAVCRGVTESQTNSCFFLDADHLQTLEYLRARTKPGEYIYVGLGRHDKIFINDVALYFLAELRASTKWHHFDPGLQSSLEIQREMIDELKRTPPRYVVLERQWDDAREPNASAQSSGVVVLDEYIRANFHQVTAFGAISVLTSEKPL